MAHRSRPQRRSASRPLGHRWSLAAFSLPRFGSGAYGRSCQAAPRCPMAPLITVQCGRDDKPAAEHQAGRQLGQQYCPTLPCQILIMNARVRLSRKSTFAFEVSSSVPKKPSEQVRARARLNRVHRPIRGHHRASVAWVEHFSLVPRRDGVVQACRRRGIFP